MAEPARKPGTFTRWGIPALVGVLALLFGIGIGAAGDSSAEDLEAGSTGEPTPAPTVTVDPSAARQAELDKIATDLDAIAAGQAKVNEELAAGGRTRGPRAGGGRSRAGAGHRAGASGI